MNSKTSYKNVGIGLAIFAGVATILQMLCGMVVEYGVEAGWAWTSATIIKWLIIFVPMYGIALPIAMQWFKKAPVEPMEFVEQSKFSFGKMLKLFVIGIGILVVGNLVGNLIGIVVSGNNSNDVLSVLAEGSAWKVLATVVLAPLFEEFVFRKTLIDRLSPYGEKQAVLFTALTFGLFHMNVYQFFYAFGLGLVLGYTYVRTRKLRYSVILHALINFVGSVVGPFFLSHINLEKLASGMTPDLMAQMSETELAWLGAYGCYIIVYIIVSIVGVVLFFVNAKKTVYLPKENELAKEESFKTKYLNLGYILYFFVCMVVCVSLLLNLGWF